MVIFRGTLKTTYLFNSHHIHQGDNIMLINNHLNILETNRKTVLITGSGRGIGKAAALYFAAHDPQQWNIVINNKHNAMELEHTKKEILNMPNTRCLAISADVGDYNDCHRMFDQILHTFGSVDVLINNAGIAHIGLFTDMKPEQWEYMLHTNLYSVINCCHLAVPDMVHRQAGKIINISSVWGNAGASCEAVYSASKGGINAFTKALAKELAPSHIQVNAIACGAIDTEMNNSLSPQEREALIEEIPACRMGRPEEVGALIYSLSCGHDYLTGQVITLDGAWM